jgi:hypothetical protein
LVPWWSGVVFVVVEYTRVYGREEKWFVEIFESEKEKETRVHGEAWWLWVWTGL